jgi:carbamoyltransferase
LDKHVAEWFEEDDDVPFMMQVFQIRTRTAHPCGHPCGWFGPPANGIPTHQSALLPLIDSFRDLTGVPMVLNTSFNENEPVVCESRQALDCFLRTKKDMLVMGQAVLHRADSN